MLYHHVNYYFQARKVKCLKPLKHFCFDEITARFIKVLVKFSDIEYKAFKL